MSTNIVVLDCQKMFLEGLTAYFDKNSPQSISINTCSTFQEVVTYLEELNTDILILEMNIEDHDAMQIIKDVKSQYSKTRIIVLSYFTDSKLVKCALLNGADAYVSKSSSFSELIYAINEVDCGNVYLGTGLRTSPASIIIEENNKSKEYGIDSFTRKQRLTKREKEILELITQGKNNKIIGNELFISDQTVGVHRKNIMKKLGTKNTALLIKFAFENHLV
ncbi:MAG: response regulator transcription factor [Saprospiraceae bacterium]